jgi:hypothetical protein
MERNAECTRMRRDEIQTERTRPGVRVYPDISRERLVIHSTYSVIRIYLLVWKYRLQ